MNITRLLVIADRILKEPEHFNMNLWHSPCDTVHCIGGWAAVLYSQRTPLQQTDNTSRKLLGLTYEQAEYLFYLEDWPPEWEKAYTTAKTYADKAQIAHDYILKYIDMYATEKEKYPMWNADSPTVDGYYWHRTDHILPRLTKAEVKWDGTVVFWFFGELEFSDSATMLLDNGQFWSERMVIP